MLAAVTDERDGPRIDARILGLLDLRVDGESVEIATRRQRALLVLLLVNVGRVVSTERLIDQLWDGTPPPQGAVTLRSYVSNLRQALGATGALGSALVTRGPGYLIDLPAESVDAMRLRTLTQTGRDLLRQGAVADALTTLDEAVGLWTGDPLAEVSDHQFAQSIVAQLTETYLAAMEGRFEAMLAAGRHADALPALDGFAADHPLREEPQALLMLALYRCGRTPDALEVHRRFRVMLDEELGILPRAAWTHCSSGSCRRIPTSTHRPPHSRPLPHPSPQPRAQRLRPPRRHCRRPPPAVRLGCSSDASESSACCKPRSTD